MRSLIPADRALRGVTFAAQRDRRAGGGADVVEPLNLSRLVKEAGSLLQVSIPKNVQLQLKLDPELPSIEADAGQMQQLIMNLVIKWGTGYQ